MAFLQADITPSTAPVSSVRTVRPRMMLAPAPVPSRYRSSQLLGRLTAALIATGALSLIGMATARATESLAIGILAADVAFLVVVAGWSAVAGGARR